MFLTSSMKKIILIQVFVFINSFVFTQTIVRLDNSQISAQQLNNKMNQLIKDASVTGIAINVFNDGKPVYHKVFGYKNSETKVPLQTSTNFYGASFSKSVFAVLVLKLVEEKKIGRASCRE